MRIPEVTAVAVVGSHRLRLTFSDGAQGEVDVASYLAFEGELAPLRDPTFFARVALEPEGGTIVWPNGVDLDPLVLYSKVTGKPVELNLPHVAGGVR